MRRFFCIHNQINNNLKPLIFMAEEKNTVFVELYDLTLTERTDDRFGRVLGKPLLRIDNLIHRAVARRTDLNPETLRASYNILKEVALEEYAGGSPVEFGMTYYGHSVSGVFYGDNAQWDSALHTLTPRLTPTAELRSAVKATAVKVRGMAASGTYINTVTDVASGEVNSRLTPGGPVNVTGSKIKIAGDSPEVGIYLQRQGDNDDTISIPANFVSANEPSKLSFVAPAGLPAGDYRLTVVTQFTSSNKLLKEPRICTLEHLLAVTP
jgi:hypothetical protein